MAKTADFYLTEIENNIIELRETVQWAETFCTELSELYKPGSDDNSDGIFYTCYSTMAKKFRKLSDELRHPVSQYRIYRRLCSLGQETDVIEDDATNTMSIRPNNPVKEPTRADIMQKIADMAYAPDAETETAEVIEEAEEILPDQS